MNRISLILLIIVVVGLIGYYLVLDQQTEVAEQTPALQPEVVFECSPEGQQTAEGAISESPDQVQAITDLLGADASENAIRETVTRLRQSNPNAGADAIADFVAMAYCPNVAAEDGLSDSEKRQKLTDFTNRVLNIAGQQ